MDDGRLGGLSSFDAHPFAPVAAPKVKGVPKDLGQEERFRAHPLYLAYIDAFHQATGGKGVRHGGDATPFYDQLWVQVADAQGTGFLLGQAVKKLQEAGTRVLKPDTSAAVGDEAWEREVLGAIVYAGMAILHARGAHRG